MNLTPHTEGKAKQVRQAVKEYFQESPETKVPAKDLMELFIKKGIFNKNRKNGYPIRELLRKLHRNDSLRLIPQAHFEQKKVNKSWFFIKTNAH